MRYGIQCHLLLGLEGSLKDEGAQRGIPPSTGIHFINNAEQACAPLRCKMGVRVEVLIRCCRSIQH